MFRHFDKRRSVFLQLLLSLFVVFFMTTLFTGVASYLMIRSTVAEQTYEHNLETLRQTSRVIETVLDATERMAVRLAQNGTVQKIVLVDWSNIGEHYQSLRQVRDMIEDELASTPYVHSIFLLNPLNRRVLSVSGIYPLSAFPDWVSLAAQEKPSSRWVGPREARSSGDKRPTVITLVVDVPVGEVFERSRLIVNLDERLFYDTVVRRSHSEGGLAILNGDSVVLSVADKSLLTERLTLSDLYPTIGGAGDGYYIVTGAAGRQFVSIVTSDYNGWRYVASMPYRRVMSVSRRILMLSVGVSLVFLGIGFALSVLVSRRFYKPIQSLVSLIGGRQHGRRRSKTTDTGAVNGDEFELLYDSVHSLLRENRRYQERYGSMDAILREHFLTDLVLGRTRERKAIREDAKSFGVDLDAGSFTVLVLRISAGEVESRGYSTELRELRYRIYGIASGVLERHCPGFVIDFGKTDLVVTVTGDTMDEIATCRSIAAEAHSVISADLGIDTVYGIGRTQGSHEAIAVSYEQALLAIEYTLVSDSGSIVSITDVVPDEKLHAVILEHRRTIDEFLQLFRRQEYEAASSLAEEIVERVTADRHLGKLHVTMLCHELLSSFLSLLISFDLDLNEVYGDDAHLFHDLAAAKDARGAGKFLAGSVKTAVDHLSHRSSIRRRDFVGRMDAFVEDRYQEAIGLTEAAEHAHMNRQYFCSVFKSAFGTTFGEYLARYRVERAAELLLSTPTTVAEVATAVGFSSTRTFIRAFRTMKGVTPAKYRLSVQFERR